MSKFDTIRNFLEEVADPKTNEETLRALNLVYQNAQEIISCYPDIATFLINVTNAVETFPMKRVLQAKKTIRENIANFIDTVDDDNDGEEELAPVYEQEVWCPNYKSLSSHLRSALRNKLGMDLAEVTEVMLKINAAQGKDYTAQEAKTFLACQRAADQIFLKATVDCNDDTYYLIKAYSKYAVFIQNKDNTGILYEIKQK
jgi:hypothetical protein